MTSPPIDSSDPFGASGAPGSSRRREATVAASGLLLLLLFAFLVRLSAQFQYGGETIDRPIVTLVIVMMTAGATYLVVVAALLRLKASLRLSLMVIGAGVIFRILMMFSTPMLEDDYYRYLWDGGLTAHGYNPYKYIPEEAASGAGTLDGGIEALAAKSGHVVHRINHAELGTIYPPMAQGAFAAAHFIRPWSLGAWRFVVFAFDFAILGSLALLLNRLGKPIHQVAIYWWNPLVIKEFFGSVHMDVVILPFVLAALWFALGQKPIRTAAALALATSAKMWPVMLIPLCARGLNLKPRRLVPAALLGTLALVILFSPVYATFSLGDASGFLAFGKRWEMNDALFVVILQAAKGLATVVPVAWGLPDAPRVARIMAFGLLLLCTGLLCARPVTGPQDLCNRAALITAGLFMLSPAQFPWYYLWIVPLLTLSPRASMLSLTLTMPLYYLKFYYAARQEVQFFHNVIVWIEYGPALALILFEAYRARRLARPGA